MYPYIKFQLNVCHCCWDNEQKDNDDGRMEQGWYYMPQAILWQQGHKKQFITTLYTYHNHEYKRECHGRNSSICCYTASTFPVEMVFVVSCDFPQLYFCSSNHHQSRTLLSLTFHCSCSEKIEIAIDVAIMYTFL